MDFSDFRSRAIAEGKRYGKDEYVFVREFAQNARDAGASGIVLNTDYNNEELVVTFVDNGVGMSFAHARDYLFTLYASSKEGEAASAGQFGVGFWSILLFSPDRIVISSNTSSESWGVEFNQALDGERRIEPIQSKRGTCVLAFKRMSAQAAAIAENEIETALLRYCRFLRQNDRSATPLSVRFNGRRIDGPLTLEGECAATFEYADVQGAVALGKSPKVNLYVRGLPVWMGTSLSELEYGASPEVQISYPRGLAPMYLLNGNKLSVTLDRRSVFDDAALQRARRIAQREMRKLVAGYLDLIAPSTWRSRLEFAYSAFVEDFWLHFSKKLVPVGILLCTLALAAGLLWFVFPNVATAVFGDATDSNTDPLEVIAFGGRGLRSSGEYRQATTEVGEGRPVAIRYSPASESFYFRSQVAEIVDVNSGAKAGSLTPYRLPADFQCKKQCVRIEVELDDTLGIYHLPVPTGYYVDHTSIYLAPGQQGELVRSAKDDWLFIQKQAPSGGGKVAYTAGKATTSIHNRESLLQLPQIQLPAPYREALAKAKTFKSKEKQVDQLSLFVEASIIYDTSAATAASYERFFSATSPGNWFDFVFQLNKGDCDVKNILLVAILRRMGIPARLAVGYVGEGGETRPGKHAWVEYYNKGWHISDATGQASEENAPAVAAADASMNEPEAEDTDKAQASVSAAPTVPHPNDTVAPAATAPVKRLLWVDWVLQWWPVGLGLLLLPLMIWMVMRCRKCKVVHQPTPKQEQLAAQLLQAALEDEKLNPKGSGLFSRNLVPTWQAGCRVSMNHVLSLGRRAKLFYAATQSPLVERMQAAGAVVVNVSNDAFVPVVGRLGGSFSVDELNALSPVPVATVIKEDTTISHVMAHLIQISTSLGLPRNGIVPCRDEMGTLFKEMDISALPVPWKKEIPSRFIAVSINDEKQWHRLVQLGDSTYGAALLLLDRMAAHCAVFQARSRAIRALLAEWEQGERR